MSEELRKMSDRRKIYEDRAKRDPSYVYFEELRIFLPFLAINFGSDFFIQFQYFLHFNFLKKYDFFKEGRVRGEKSMRIERSEIRITFISKKGFISIEGCMQLNSIWQFYLVFLRHLNSSFDSQFLFLLLLFNKFTSNLFKFVD